MISYSSIANKDDKAFLSVAKRVLRQDYDLAISDAREAFQVAYREESNKLHKVNAARRAANLVILDCLKQYGVTNWRKIDEKEEVKKAYKPDGPVALPVSNRKKKWEGPSIIQMAEQNKLNKK